jgi:hypothetical protein
MTTLTIEPRQNAEQKAATTIASSPATSASKGPGFRLPYFVPKGQVYYWTLEWQKGEAEALADLAEGRVRRFASGADAATWLLADED